MPEVPLCSWYRAEHYPNGCAALVDGYGTQLWLSTDPAFIVALYRHRLRRRRPGRQRPWRWPSERRSRMHTLYGRRHGHG